MPGDAPADKVSEKATGAIFHILLVCGLEKIDPAPFPLYSDHKLAGLLLHKLAKEPNDLEKFFVERANAGDVEGLVVLYETNAILVCGDGERFVGADQIRKFFMDYLIGRPQLTASDQAPALCSGNLALTSSQHSNGDVSAEIARRQPNGNWLWTIDQFALAKSGN